MKSKKKLLRELKELREQNEKPLKESPKARRKELHNRERQLKEKLDILNIFIYDQDKNTSDNKIDILNKEISNIKKEIYFIQTNIEQLEAIEQHPITDRGSTNKRFVLSLTYLHYLKQSYKKLKLILFLCVGLSLGLSLKFPQINLSLFPFILLAFVLLLIIKEQLLEYRIRQGVFGTNPAEARTLIEFIIKNSEGIDFTDSNGNLRRALLPEAEPIAAEQPLPAFGEEASA